MNIMEQNEILNKNIDIEIIRSKRKTVSISIGRDCTVTVRVPEYVSEKDVLKFIQSKEKWILKHLRQMKEKAVQSDVEKLDESQIKELYQKAREEIPKEVSYYAKIVGVDYGRITIRSQKTRWGSCSSKGNLNFNCLLMLAPKEVREYVVVHELCHRKQMNHSEAFWKEVEKAMPDYKEKKTWLKENGGELMNKIF